MNYKSVLDSYAWSEFFDGSKEGSIAKNISLADCLHFQTAKSLNALFVTGDPDFKEVKEGVLFLKELKQNGSEDNSEA